MQKLDAVNGCLKAVGLSPVTSLDAGPDATKATTHVDAVSEKVQESGWSCNRDIARTFPIDVNGRCVLPAYTLSASVKDYNASVPHASVRKDSFGIKFLWDVSNNTDNFSASAPGGVTVDIVYLFAFDDLTTILQRYIAERAAREYQESDLGSGMVDKFTSRKEQDAYVALVSAEAEEEDWNSLTDNDHCAMITGRNNDFFGR
jgi:hypothetical protein